MTRQEMENYLADIELHRTFVTYGLQRLRRYSLGEQTKNAWISGMKLHAQELVKRLDELQADLRQETVTRNMANSQPSGVFKR